MAVIHAGITPANTAGHRDLVLVAGGVLAEEVATAAKRLQLLTPLFTKTDPPGGLKTPATWPAVVQLSAAFGDAFRPTPELADWISEQITLRTQPPSGGLAYVPPAGLELRPYQVDGAELIARTGRALIFDEPRTGKTITTIVGLVEWASVNWRADGPVVVVCPASVVDPWVEAWRTWAPHVRAVAWRGPKRAELAGTADVYVTSYDTARIDAPASGPKLKRAMLALDPMAVVVDECHLIKNQGAQRSQAVRRIAKKATAKGGAVVGLSGTPITHHPADLWPMLVALEPDAWPARERWVKRFCETVTGDYDETILGLHPYTEAEFRLCLLGQHRRVARADVMSQLPPKVYSVRTVELPAQWRKAYDDFESQMLAELPEDGGELAVMDTLSVLSHLSALSCAPADVEVTYGPDVDEKTGEPKRHVHLELKPTSWKVEALLEILAERPGEKVVVFAESAQLIRLAGEAAAKAGHRVGYIIGGQSAKARTETRLAFQDGDLNLICATTGAGGTGITLSAAGTLVFLQRPWSLVESLQAEDRAEGDLTSTRGTEVIDVVASNTVDSRRRAVLKARAGQLAALLQDPRIVAELLGGASVKRLKEAS